MDFLRNIFLAYFLFAVAASEAFSESPDACSEKFAKLFEKRVSAAAERRRKAMDSALDSEGRWDHTRLRQVLDETEELNQRVWEVRLNRTAPAERGRLAERRAYEADFYRERKLEGDRVFARDRARRSTLEKEIQALRAALAQPLPPNPEFSQTAERMMQLRTLLESHGELRNLTRITRKANAPSYGGLSAADYSARQSEYEALLSVVAKRNLEEKLPWRLQLYLMPEEFRNPLISEWAITRARYLFKGSSRGSMGKRDLSHERALGARYVEGDEGVRTLRELGYSHVRPIAKGEAALMGLPMRFEDLAANILKRIESWKANGLIRDEDALYPSLYFKSRSSNEHKLVRIGVDPWPDPKLFKISGDMPQFNNRDWSNMLAEGKFPLSFNSTMGDHDIAHWSEFMENPALMKATRDHFKRVQSLSREDAKDFIHGLDHGVSKQVHGPAASMGLRSLYFTEFFDLPNFSKRAAFYERFPELTKMSASEAENWKVHLGALQNLTPEQLQERAKRWIQLEQGFIRRQGGGIRDSYNYELNLKPVATVVEDYKKVLRKQARSRSDKDKWSHTELMRSGLLHSQAELEVLFKLRYGTNPASSVRQYLNPIDLYRVKQEIGYLDPFVLDSMIRERVARLESGFRTGLEAGLTPEKAVTDSSTMKFSAESATHKFVKSMAPEFSMHWEAFVSPEAMGP